ncbi:MipA/OmpV family protein, partial [Blastomonas sp.]|uniref:MipA/OmpV family protein n=1 Tax=Blastomonas sp. TaxID=1909299 RepID=UPI0035939398
MFTRLFVTLALMMGTTASALAQDTQSDFEPAPGTVVIIKPTPSNLRPYGPSDAELELLGFGARLSQSVFAQDFYMTVGLGAGFVPSYEGSDQYVLFPAPVLQGSYKGYAFATRGPGLFVDLVKDPLFPKVEYIAGPLIRARFDRNVRIRDDVVERLGKLDIAVELGGSAGVKVNRIFHRFDSLTFQTDAVFDVAGAHSGAVVTPSISYGTPLGEAGVFNLTVSGDVVDNSFADYYFSVDAPGSAASGLPQFRARGGLKSVGASALIAYDLSGNALDGGRS